MEDNKENKEVISTGLWNDVTDEQGNHSLSTHTPKLIAKFCRQEDHYWEAKSPGSRELKCKECGMESYYVLGYQQLINGKVITQG